LDEMVSTALVMDESDDMSIWITVRVLLDVGNPDLTREIAASPLLVEREPRRMVYGVLDAYRALIASRPSPVLPPVMRITFGEDILIDMILGSSA